MSKFNLFVTSSPATTVFDAATLTDRLSIPPKDYWVFSQTHSLTFYTSEVIANGLPYNESLGRVPHFSVDLHADIQRMIKWPSPADDVNETSSAEGLLLLTETSMLYLVEPDFEKRKLIFISKVDLNVSVFSLIHAICCLKYRSVSQIPVSQIPFTKCPVESLHW